MSDIDIDVTEEVLEFEIVQTGPKGDTGATGAQGEQGEKGDPGNEVINALGNISGAKEIDLSDGTLVTATLTGAVSPTFTGLPAAGRVLSFVLQFTNVEEITWPAGTVFAEIPDPAGTLYEIPCSIVNDGTLTVHGLIDNYS